MTPEQRRRYEQAAPVKKRQPIEVLRYWVNQCLMDRGKLNDWELRFLGDIDSNLTWYGRIFEAEEEKLEQIYAEKTKL